MTRFARKLKAVGTVHREPEDATPWSQLVATIQPRNFTVEDDEDYVQDDNLEEDDASGDEQEQQTSLVRQLGPGAGENVDSENANEDNSDNLVDEKETETETVKVDVLKRKHSVAVKEDEAEKPSKKKRKKTEKCKICGSTEHLKRFCEQLSEERRKELQDTYNAKTAAVKSKEKKPLTALEKLACGEKPKSEEIETKNVKQKEKNKNKNNKKEKSENLDNKKPKKFDNERQLTALQKLAYGENPKNEEVETENFMQKNKNNNKEKPRNFAYDENPNLMQIGGKNEDYNKKMPRNFDNERPRNLDNRNKYNQRRDDVVRDLCGAEVKEGEALFQGFRVTKDDRDKLLKLAKDLKSKGLTKDELAEVLKRERRIAEHRLARFNKLTCFKCKKAGHTIACCPEAGDRSLAPDSGVCFKCGSLDHTSKSCPSKAKDGDAYNFATCFICKQVGHLSKACPDNPKGLYPQGGGCFYCGSVEHFAKDCHIKIQKDIRRAVLGGMIQDDNIEDEQPRFNVFKAKHEKPAKKVPKVVKF